MYIICTYGQRHRLNVYINIYVQHGTGVDRDLPQCILGSVTIYNIYRL